MRKRPPGDDLGALLKEVSMKWRHPDTTDPSMINLCRNKEGFVTRKMTIDGTPCEIHCQHMAKDWPCCCCGHTDASEQWYYDHDEELREHSAAGPSQK